MRMLLFGGSWSLGRLVTENLARQGCAVFTFNGGRRSAARPRLAGVASQRPELRAVRHLHGDRRDPSALRALAEQGPWDAVIDISGKAPAVVGLSASALARVTGLFVYVSTLSVYRDWPLSFVDERSPVWPDDTGTEPPGHGPSSYGVVRHGCELACRRVLTDDRLSFVRLHTVLGQHEDLGGLRWWLHRTRRGGQVLLPDPDRPFQAVDVRDLAEFLLRLAVRGEPGVVNAAAPLPDRSFGDLVRSCADVVCVGERPEFVPVDGDWLLAQGVQEGTELPMWLAGVAGGVGSERAAAAGLRCRPFTETVDPSMARPARVVEV